MDSTPTFPAYSVGPHELDEYEWAEIKGDYVWMVYYYEQGGYDGDGLAVALRTDGQIAYNGLSHCSCYGPTAYWSDDPIPVEDFLRLLDRDDGVPGGRDRSPNDYDYKEWAAIGPKVRELLGKREKERKDATDLDGTGTQTIPEC